MIRPIRKDLGDLRDVMVSATEPTTRNDGDALQANDVWLDLGNDLWKVYDGSAFQAIGGGSSPLTTKGDLYTYDTDDARLPVGSDGQVLTADSAESTGLKWAASSGGGSGAMALLDETILSADGTLDVTSFATTGYRHLRIYAWVRSTRGSDESGLDLRLGTGGTIDTGSNYSYTTRGVGPVAPGQVDSDSYSASLIQVGQVPGDTSVAGAAALVTIDILYYATTGAFWRGIWVNSGWISSSGSARRFYWGMAWWKNTADAIDSIRLFDRNVTDLLTGSRASVYGIE